MASVIEKIANKRDKVHCVSISASHLYIIMQDTLKNRTIFCRDNLEVLRGIDSNTVDLIYLDPPFNKKKQFAAPIGSSAEGASFKDYFREEDVKEEWLGLIADKQPALYDYIHGIAKVGDTSNKYYLCYMSIRIIELHRVLRETGSIYLHCDSKMSHYLKLLMDCVFGEQSFRNEITWQRSLGHNLASKRFDAITDTILFYSKSNAYYYTSPRQLLDEDEMSKKFPYTEKETGRRYTHRQLEQSSNAYSVGETRNFQDKVLTTKLGWRWAQKTIDERLSKNPYLIYWTSSGRPRYKTYKDEYEGRLCSNLWSDIDMTSNERERVSYPTQKPLKLLERIISTSSNEGDVVLDPFCGCATTCVAAERLKRQWVGIDVSQKAFDLVKVRLNQEVEWGTLPVYKGKAAFPDKNLIYREDIPARTEVEVKTHTISNKHYLFGLQEGKCKGCDILFNIQNLTIDHLVPKAKGGGNNRENLQLLCTHCNSVKRDRDMPYLLSKLKEKGIIK